MTDPTHTKDAGPPLVSDNLLSQSAPDAGQDARFSVAEEVSMDQQADSVRRVGRMPAESGAPQGSAAPAEAMAEAMHTPPPKDNPGQAPAPAIERAVPPSSLP